MRSPGDWRRHWPLFVPVCVSSILSSWALGTVGWGNTYYSAAVRSMSESWRAFWYGAFDRAGFVTVDKPPFSLWVQALVVRVFGFHPMSLLVPQVVAGVSTVVLVYSLLVGRWGRLAATVGALVLAVTPMSVMVAHSNNTDAVLVLAMAATLYGVVRAIDSGRWSWTIGTGLLFGIAFTTKMLAAAPVLPAVVLAFALGSPLARAPRMRRLAVLSAVAVMSALFWFSAVDLTPDASRPYVGSSADNSAFQLAFERNGINQVEGGQVMTGGPGGPPPGGPPPGMGPGGRPGSEIGRAHV